jgi:hypothetical protein
MVFYITKNRVLFCTLSMPIFRKNFNEVPRDCPKKHGHFLVKGVNQYWLNQWK